MPSRSSPSLPSCCPLSALLSSSSAVAEGWFQVCSLAHFQVLSLSATAVLVHAIKSSSHMIRVQYLIHSTFQINISGNGHGSTTLFPPPLPAAQIIQNKLKIMDAQRIFNAPPPSSLFSGAKIRPVSLGWRVLFNQDCGLTASR